MQVRVLAQPFDPWDMVQAYLAAHPGLAGKHGANALFIGSLRDFNAGRAVSAMQLEHYPGMTEKQLAKIGEEASARWALLDVLLVHRCGPLRPGDPIVLVSVWSAHRHDAFEACRYAVEALKTRAPFWKQEQTDDGPRWVTPAE